MIARAAPEPREEAKVLRKEADELQRIFITIVKNPVCMAKEQMVKNRFIGN